MSKKEISEERKALYYGGMVVSGIGLLLFLSAFLSFMNPASMLMGSSPGSFMMRPFIGIIMIAAGGFMRTVAVRDDQPVPGLDDAGQCARGLAHIGPLVLGRQRLPAPEQRIPAKCCHDKHVQPPRVATRTALIVCSRFSA